MKSTLEPDDIQAIVDAVAARLSPIMPATPANTYADEIFDVPGLASYLKVDKSWVYKQLQFKSIPHFHAGRYPRFHKHQIDSWTKENSTPAIESISQPGKLKQVA